MRFGGLPQSCEVSFLSRLQGGISRQEHDGVRRLDINCLSRSGDQRRGMRLPLRHRVVRLDTAMKQVQGPPNTVLLLPRKHGEHFISRSHHLIQTFCGLLAIT